MHGDLTLERMSEIRGTNVYSSDGDKIGSVEEIFYDEQTREPEWIGIGTGFFRSKRVLVPIANADVKGDGVYVPYSKEQVKGSPDIDADEISEDAERELYSYYGLQYSEQRSDSGLPEGTMAGRGIDTAEEGSVTRTEEELRVGTRPVEAGGVRLSKWVETEPVSEDVKVSRETAWVEREPVDQPASSSDMGDQQVDVTLQAEEPVVQKQAVAKERVRVGKDVESRTETVSDEVRKERVDVEGDEKTQQR